MKKIEKRLDDIKDDLKKIIKKRKEEYKEQKEFLTVLGNYVAGFCVVVGGICIVTTGILTLFFSSVLLGLGLSLMIKKSCIIEYKKLEEYKKLKDFIKDIEDNGDDNFYISYVITDYLGDENYDINKIRQLNEYISMFDKEEINLCTNDVGLSYNYRPYSEVKAIEQKDNKQDINLLGKNLKKEEKSTLYSYSDMSFINYILGNVYMEDTDNKVETSQKRLIK